VSRKPGAVQRDKHIVEELKKERSGILASFLRGFFEWKKHGLNPPAKVTEATAEYRENEDSIGQFILERCFIKESAVVKAGDLYQDYKKWCESMGFKPEWGQNFGRRLSAKFVKKKVKGCFFYHGIGLLEGG